MADFVNYEQADSWRTCEKSLGIQKHRVYGDHVINSKSADWSNRQSHDTRAK